MDSRWGRGSQTGIVPWSGAGLYGCSFGLPTELALKTNGFDEACQLQSAEDYDFGIRVERAGGKFFYNINAASLESDEMHSVEPSLPRESKLVLPQFLPAGYEGNPMSDHVMLNRVRNETNRISTIFNYTNLRQAREEFLASGRAMIPTGPVCDWRDGKPLSEL